MSLSDEIKKAIALKSGSQEFILYRYGPERWQAGIGNPWEGVLAMMESEPEYSGNGETPEVAVANLILCLQKDPGRTPKPSPHGRWDSRGDEDGVALTSMVRPDRQDG